MPREPAPGFAASGKSHSSSLNEWVAEDGPESDKARATVKAYARQLNG